MTKKVKIRRENPVYIPLRANQTRYSEGDVVDTPDGLGIVVEVREENFEGPEGSEVEASDNSPTYVVGLEDEDTAVGVYKASDLNSDDLPETDVDDPVEDVAGEAASNTANIIANDFDYPDSWQESETPARIILLDAWSSMGGQFDCGGACCKGTMRQAGMGENASDEFCASMKDRVLGGWQGWRRGG